MIQHNYPDDDYIHALKASISCFGQILALAGYDESTALQEHGRDVTTLANVFLEWMKETKKADRFVSQYVPREVVNTPGADQWGGDMMRGTARCKNCKGTLNYSDSDKTWVHRRINSVTASCAAEPEE